MRLLWLIIPWSVYSHQPEINTNAGTILGFQIPTVSGSKADVFLGVPFARPPIGELRFEKPQPPIPWKTALNATYWSKECFPHTAEAIFMDASEDCLTLNIIKPSRKSAQNGYPILVWIHGGGFSFGTAKRTPYQGFADAYSTRDVIVISIQYRLGPLGFLSTGKNDLPGNLGLWDMTEALKFIYQNARAFDGDPKRITLWGLSAGGAAVGQLLLSPHSRNYATAGIEMSGSPWCNWALGNQVAQHSLPFIDALGCSTNIKTCLKSKSIEEIYAAVDKVGHVLDNLLITKWGPRLDGDFFPDNLEGLAREAPAKPVIYGLSEREAGYFTIMDKSKTIHRLRAHKDLHSFGAKEFRERISDLILSTAHYGTQSNKVIEQVLNFYSKGYGEAKYLNDYTEFVSDILFNVPLAVGAEIRRKNGWPTYLYVFEQYNEAIWKNFDVPKEVEGSVHINEFPYMYDSFAIASFNFTEDDKIVMNNLRDSFATFAHNGIASWNNVRWKDAGNEGRYIRIKGNPEEATGFFKDSLNFWKTLKNTGFDLIELATVPATKEEL